MTESSKLPSIDFSRNELTIIGEMTVAAMDDAGRAQMKVLASRLPVPPPKPGDHTLLYLGGPNHVWLKSGEDAAMTLGMFAGFSGADPKVGDRIHEGPRYYRELPLAGISETMMKELGLRIEFAVYQLETIGDPSVARFLGWYGDLHDEHGKHIDGDEHDDHSHAPK